MSVCEFNFFPLKTEPLTPVVFNIGDYEAFNTRRPAYDFEPDMNAIYAVSVEDYYAYTLTGAPQKLPIWAIYGKEYLKEDNEAPDDTVSIQPDSEGGYMGTLPYSPLSDKKLRLKTESELSPSASQNMYPGLDIKKNYIFFSYSSLFGEDLVIDNKIYRMISDRHPRTIKNVIKITASNMIMERNWDMSELENCVYFYLFNFGDRVNPGMIHVEKSLSIYEKKNGEEEKVKTGSPYVRFRLEYVKKESTMDLVKKNISNNNYDSDENNAILALRMTTSRYRLRAKKVTIFYPIDGRVRHPLESLSLFFVPSVFKEQIGTGETEYLGKKIIIPKLQNISIFSDSNRGSVIGVEEIYEEGTGYEEAPVLLNVLKNQTYKVAIEEYPYTLQSGLCEMGLAKFV